MENWKSVDLLHLWMPVGMDAPLLLASQLFLADCAARRSGQFSPVTAEHGPLKVSSFAGNHVRRGLERTAPYFGCNNIAMCLLWLSGFPCDLALKPTEWTQCAVNFL